MRLPTWFRCFPKKTGLRKTQKPAVHERDSCQSLVCGRLHRRRQTTEKHVHYSNEQRQRRDKSVSPSRKVADEPKEMKFIIDAMDASDELAVVEYVGHCKLAEQSCRIADYMSSQPEINLKMRKDLVEWVIKVHDQCRMVPETLYLAIYIIDRYLSMEMVQATDLQLVGISTMLIAKKYEELRAVNKAFSTIVIATGYPTEKRVAMEKRILSKLKWRLTVPTPYAFLVRFLKVAKGGEELEDMVFFFSELGLMEYSMIKYPPSVFAASAVYAAHCTLKKSPLWNERLKYHTGFSEDQLLECAKTLVACHSAAHCRSGLKFVYEKYSTELHSYVALRPAATKVMKELMALRKC